MNNKNKSSDKDQPDERELPHDRDTPHESLTNKPKQDHRRANPDKDEAMIEKGIPSRR